MTPTRKLGRRARQALLCIGALAALVACGGGTSQFTPFAPNRLFAFGDETSVLTPDGHNYAVNGVNLDGSIDCKGQPIWVQAVAALYNFAFAECNPTGQAATQARMFAVVGAKADDLKDQIDLQVSLGGFAESDLVTVMIGANDVLDLYLQYPAQTEAALGAELLARGTRLAQQVNRLVAMGARVIVSTVYDLGLTPYALDQRLVSADTDRAALLTRLTFEFNRGMRVNILQDGRYIGLVLADEWMQAAVASPGSYGLTNVTLPVCNEVLPNCTTNTLVTGGSASTWLWADGTRLSAGGQLRLGNLAVARARGNPF